MSELLDAGFELASADLAPKTAHEYERIIRARIRPALGHRPVRQVEASEIDRFDRAPQRQAGLSAASVRHVHAILSKAMGQAVKWGWIAESPIPRTSPPPVRRSEVIPPEPADVVRLLEGAREYDADFGLLLLLAASTHVEVAVAEDGHGACLRPGPPAPGLGAVTEDGHCPPCLVVAHRPVLR